MENVKGWVGQLKLFQKLPGPNRIEGKVSLRIDSIASHPVQQALQGVVSLGGGHLFSIRLSFAPIILGSIFVVRIEDAP